MLPSARSSARINKYSRYIKATFKVFDGVSYSPTSSETPFCGPGLQESPRTLSGRVGSSPEFRSEEICTGRTQRCGRNIVRNKFREVDGLRSIKCYPRSETKCAGNTMTNR